MGQVNARETLQSIEGAGSAEAAYDKTKELFDHYDTDDSGYLTGYESGAAVVAISEYIFDQYRGKNRLNIGKIRYWVDSNLDINKDGKISRKEFVTRIHYVLTNHQRYEKSFEITFYD
jgi:Ca2+-binding EF-hand superfamily protein